MDLNRRIDLLLSHDVRHGLLVARYHLMRLRQAVAANGAIDLKEPLESLDEAILAVDRAYRDGVKRIMDLLT
jgi:predicted transcriptional regulator